LSMTFPPILMICSSCLCIGKISVSKNDLNDFSCLNNQEAKNSNSGLLIF